MLNKKIVDKIIDFRDERDWKQFHTPKNLAISISLEANELLELYQWAEHVDKIDVEEEIADIAIYLLTFCYDNNINLEEAIEKKIKINARNYPVELAKGSSKKHPNDGMYP